MQRIPKKWRLWLLLFLLAPAGVGSLIYTNEAADERAFGAANLDWEDIPKWEGAASIPVNDNLPFFTKKQKTQSAPYVKYSEPDSLGRAGCAIGCLGEETINHGDRADIGPVRPSGWQTEKYPDLIADLYVYNRCHLLMQAAAAGWDKEACNSEKNLITGTKYLNVDGMLPYENRLFEYIKETGRHVLYRVTPIYDGVDAVARGVLMEAYSIEDEGSGIEFCTFCYNVQPGVSIDYSTGRTKRSKNANKEVLASLEYGPQTVIATKAQEEATYSTGKNTAKYVLNTNTRRIHRPDCPSVKDISKRNKSTGTFSKKKLMSQGYEPCGECKP